MQFPWRYAVALTIGCGIAALLVLPYGIELDRLNADPPGTWIWKPTEFAFYVEHSDVSRPSHRWGVPEVVAASLITVPGSLVAIILGLKLRPALAPGWPPLAGWNADTWRVRRPGSNGLLAVALGIVSVLWICASSLCLLSGEADGAGQLINPPWWVGLLASFGAGFREEVWLRLGAMTMIIWIVARLTRQKVPGSATIWSGIVLASLLFGAMHLPQAKQLLGADGLTVPLILFVLIGNGGISLIFGWLYWHKGLVAAMTAHVTQDVITKSIFPLLFS